MLKIVGLGALWVKQQSCGEKKQISEALQKSVDEFLILGLFLAFCLYLIVTESIQAGNVGSETVCDMQQKFPSGIKLRVLQLIWCTSYPL